MRGFGAVLVALTILVGLTLGERESAAQEKTGPVPGVGSIVTPRFDLPAQQTPPNFFGQAGPKVGVATADQPYMILQERSYPSLMGEAQKWLKVAPVPNASSMVRQENPAGSFWLYYGREGSSPGNLKACETTCLAVKDSPN